MLRLDQKLIHVFSSGETAAVYIFLSHYFFQFYILLIYILIMILYINYFDYRRYTDVRIGEPSMIIDGVTEKLSPHKCRLSDITLVFY